MAQCDVVQVELVRSLTWFSVVRVVHRTVQPRSVTLSLRPNLPKAECAPAVDDGRVSPRGRIGRVGRNSRGRGVLERDRLRC